MSFVPESPDGQEKKVTTHAPTFSSLLHLTMSSKGPRSPQS